MEIYIASVDRGLVGFEGPWGLDRFSARRGRREILRWRALVFGGLLDVVDDDVLGGDLDALDLEAEGAEVPVREGEGIVEVDGALVLIGAEA